MTDRFNPALLSVDSYTHSWPVVTRFADIDELGHINNLAMAAFFEDARTRFYLSRGVWIQPQERKDSQAKSAIMVVSQAFDYLAQAYYPDEVTIHTAVSAIGNSSHATTQLAIQRGLPVALCRASFAFVSKDRSSPLPTDVREILGRSLLRLSNAPIRRA